MLTEKEGLNFNEEHLRNSLQCSIKAQLNEVDILKPLNRGSQGMVYLIKPLDRDNLYALKAIWKQNGRSKKQQEKVRLRAQNEIKINKSLKSKFIVKFYKHYEDEEYYYLIFEYCQRGDLHSIIDCNSSEGVPMHEVKSLGLQIAKGISTLHSKKIVHRDIKLQNILLCAVKQEYNDLKSYEVKICDFGFACSMESDKKLTGFCGTPGYIAPEMTSFYTEKVDVWSYGCVLYLLATGRHLCKDAGAKFVTEQKFKSFIKKNTSLLFQKEKDFFDLLSKIFVDDSQNRISMKEIIKHSFFNAKLDGSLQRKLSNQISEKSQYALSRKSSFNNKDSPKQYSQRSSQSSLCSNHLITARQVKPRHERGSTQPTIRQATLKQQQSKKSEFTLKLTDSQKRRRSSKDLLKLEIQQQIHKLNNNDYESNKENNSRVLNGHNKKQSQISKQLQLVDTQSADLTNLKSEFQETSKKMIQGKLGKVVQIKSNELRRQIDKHRHQSRPTVPNRSRPGTCNSTNGCKTNDTMTKKHDQRHTINASQQNRPLILDRKVMVLSPINIQKMPQTGEIECSRGKIKINSEGFFKRPNSSNSKNQSQTSINGTNIHISSNGQRITISQGQNTVTYSLQRLPEKYRPMYKFWKNVIGIIKDGTQLSKLQLPGGNQLKIMASGRILGKLNGKQFKFKNEQEMNHLIISKTMCNQEQQRISDKDIKKILNYFRIIKKMLQQTGHY